MANLCLVVVERGTGRNVETVSTGDPMPMAQAIVTVGHLRAEFSRTGKTDHAAILRPVPTGHDGTAPDDPR